MQDHFNGLTPAEAERLAMLAEECGEVIHIIGKVLRHGYDSRHPDGGPTNREALSREILDLVYTQDALFNADDLPKHSHEQRMEVIDRKARYAHHQ